MDEETEAERDQMLCWKLEKLISERYTMTHIQVFLLTNNIYHTYMSECVCVCVREISK